MGLFGWLPQHEVRDSAAVILRHDLCAFTRKLRTSTLTIKDISMTQTVHVCFNDRHFALPPAWDRRLFDHVPRSPRARRARYFGEVGLVVLANIRVIDKRRSNIGKGCTAIRV